MHRYSVDEEGPTYAPIDSVPSVKKLFVDQVTAKRAIIRMEPGKRRIDFVLRVSEARLKLHCQFIEDREASRTPARKDTKLSSLVEKRCHKSVVRHETMVARTTPMR